QRNEIMTSLATTVKHFANLFSSCPAQNPAHRPTKHPPRFYLQHRIAFRRNRCSAEEGRIIDNQKTTSRRKWRQDSYGDISSEASHAKAVESRAAGGPRGGTEHEDGTDRARKHPWRRSTCLARLTKAPALVHTSSGSVVLEAGVLS